MSKTILLIFLLSAGILNTAAANFHIQSAEIEAAKTARAQFTGELPDSFVARLRLEPALEIDTLFIRDSVMTIQTRQPFQFDQHYYIIANDTEKTFLLPSGILDSLYSNKTLGFSNSNNISTFRVFAPRAKWVRLVIYARFDSPEGEEFPMRKDADGVWEYSTASGLFGKYYGYRVWGPQGEGEMFDSTIVVADPYSPAVAVLNRYTHPAKTLILKSDQFNWKDDPKPQIPWRDLMIYEMHVRDLTAHPSSGLPDEERGTYPGLLEKDQKGGLPYIKSLGVNAVELLPVQEFGNMEVPYRDSSVVPFNTWNPYARNHWGYMTSYFFAPESYYASGGNMTPGKYLGTDGRQVDEFKEAVRAFHKNGIAVLMDVVYNHASQYDYNPLKYIDKFYYFRLNKDCSFTSVSGCGNDIKTDRPMARRLIIDSVVHWMKDYHIDGFRFDLAKLIDWETCDMIRDAILKVNPNAVIIAEPWGGGYDPAGFSDHRWASWNDQFRNGVKGQNPNDGLGFIFGDWQGNNDVNSLRRFVTGSLRKFGGQYTRIAHSVNYLESHDDNTLGDFIRLGLKDVNENQRIADPEANARLTPRQLRINKLAALFLFTSQGPVMIHEGQEFARSKVIARTTAPDTNQGKIDHNSYNKDNATNWLNFEYADLNKHLVDYYRGLIQMRMEHAAFRNARPEDIKFLDQPDSLFLTYQLDSGGRTYLVLLNGNSVKEQNFTLQSAPWAVLVDASRATGQPLGMLKGDTVRIPPSSGLVLMKLSAQ